MPATFPGAIPSGGKSMFKKILVPLDGSKLAAKILPQVEDLAKTQEAQLTLVNVQTDWGAPDSDEVKNIIGIEAKKCEVLLVEAAKDLQAKGLKVDVACVTGDPAQEIIAYAEEKGMDLIALATHGMGEVAWVLGSVAEKVVSHATVPVLLFRVLGAKKPLLKTDFVELLERGIP
jgi:nucleotide-binding universal stress UspA family protein